MCFRRVFTLKFTVLKRSEGIHHHVVGLRIHLLKLLGWAVYVIRISSDLISFSQILLRVTSLNDEIVQTQIHKPDQHRSKSLTNQRAHSSRNQFRTQNTEDVQTLNTEYVDEKEKSEVLFFLTGPNQHREGILEIF